MSLEWARAAAVSVQSSRSGRSPCAIRAVFTARRSRAAGRGSVAALAVLVRKLQKSADKTTRTIRLVIHLTFGIQRGRSIPQNGDRASYKKFASFAPDPA